MPFFEFRGLQLEYEVWPAGGTPVLFFHANGFPAGSYGPLFRALQSAGHPVHALNFTGHGRSEATMDFRDWNYFRDQAAAFAALQTRPFFAVGHSIGGASLLMAAHQIKPERIVLLDPTIFSPVMAWLAPLLPHPLAALAEKRRARFKNRKVIERSYRMNPLFRQWNAECFNGYLDSVLEADAGELKLRMPPALEAKIFRSFHRGQWKEFYKATMPILVIRAEDSPVTPVRSAKRISRMHSESRWQSHPGTHTFPMEDPAGTAERIITFFGAHGVKS